MARLLHGDEGELFRAVVTVYEKNYGDDTIREHTQHLGPFGTGSAAQAAVTRVKTGQSRRLDRARWLAGKFDHNPGTLEDVLVEGLIQRTDIRWEAP